MSELSVKAQSSLSPPKDLDAEMLRGNSHRCAWLVTALTAACMFLPITKTHLKLLCVGITLHLLLFILFLTLLRPAARLLYFAVKFVFSYTEVVSPTCTWSPQTRGCKGPVGAKPVSPCTEISGSHGRKITTLGMWFSHAARCKKNRVLFLHSNLVESMPAAKGVTSLHSVRVL